MLAVAVPRQRFYLSRVCLIPFYLAPHPAETMGKHPCNVVTQRTQHAVTSQKKFFFWILNPTMTHWRMVSGGLRTRNHHWPGFLSQRLGLWSHAAPGSRALPGNVAGPLGRGKLQCWTFAREPWWKFSFFSSKTEGPPDSWVFLGEKTVPFRLLSCGFCMVL